MPLVSSGVENGNLRQLALDRMKDFGADCRDVRYREVGVCDERLPHYCPRQADAENVHDIDVRDSSASTATVARAPAKGLQCQRGLGDLSLLRGS